MALGKADRHHALRGAKRKMSLAKRLRTRGGIDAPSPRLRKLLVSYEKRGEELVRIFQVLLGLTAVIVLLVTYPIADYRDPRVIAISSIYTLFNGALYLYLRWQGVRWWLPYLSVLIDLTIAAIVTWNFHVRHGMPVEFSLKSPNYYFYYLLICLRVFTFNPSHVLFAGFAVALVWGAFALALYHGGFGPPRIAVDYPDYYSRPSLFGGHEWRRLFAITMLSAILAAAMYRARRFLITAVEETAAARDLARFVPSGAAEVVRNARTEIAAGHGETRDVVILNVDLRGFTGLSAKIDPDKTVQLLSAYQARLVPIIDAHGGTVDKFLGDGIMATFGTGETDATPYAASMACAQAILSEAAGWTGALGELDVNVALASGPVVCGTIGAGQRLEYTVIGPAVNASAKIEKLNKPLGTKGLSDVRTVERAIAEGHKPPHELIRHAIDGTPYGLSDTELIELRAV